MNPYRQFVSRHWRKILIGGAGALAVFALVGFFAVPPILKSILTNQLTEALHREVSIREVRFNPFALSATLRGFQAKEPKSSETFASFEELYANLESTSLFRWGAVIREVRLVKPFVHLIRHADQSYNISDLLQAQPSPQSPPAKPPRFSVNNIRIVDGGAELLDETVGKKHVIQEVNVGIPFLSNIPSQVQTFVQPGISAVVNGTRYAITGKTKPFADSQETSLDVNIADLELPYYLAYVPPELLTFTLPSGRLDAKLTVVFVRHQKTGDTLAVKGDVGLREMAVDDKQGNPVVRIPSLDLGLASVEPLVRKAHLSRLTLQAPELTVRRENTGITNLEMLLPKAPEPAKTAPVPAGEKPILDVDEINISGAKVFLSDLVPRQPFKTTLAPIDLIAKQLSTRPDVKGTYSIKLQTEVQENLALDGSVSLAPVSVDGKVEGKSVLLQKYAPYYSEMILCDIAGGTLAFSSRYKYVQGEGEPEIAASEASASLSGLRLKRSDEKDDFLRIPSLEVKDAAADMTQRQITVGSLSTQKGILIAKRLTSGEIDLQKLVPPPPAGDSKAASGAAQKPWAITLKRLELDQYAARIEDQSTPRPITLKIDKIRLNGEELSTAKNATGKLRLALHLDQTTTVSTQAAVSLDPIRAEGRVQLAGMVLNRYAPYYQNLVVFDVADGTVDLATNYRLTQAKDAFDIKIANLSTTLKALRLQTRDTQQEFLNIPLLAVKNTAADLSQQDISVGDLSTERGTVVVVRSKEGEINLVKLLPRTSAAAESLANAPVAPGAKQPARPWVVKAGAVSVSQYKIQVTDEVPSEPVNLVVDGLDVRAEKLSTALNSTPGKASVAFRVGQGTVSSEGTLDVAPIAADLQVNVKEIDIRPFQPYVADRVKVALTDGRLSTTGNLQLSTKEPPGLQAKYTGEITLGKFAAVDKVNSEDVLKWESLALRELSVGYNPLLVRAKRVSLADFFAHVVIEPNGRLNLQEIAETPGAAQPADQAPPAQATSSPGAPAKPDASPDGAPSPVTDIQIEELTMQGGRIQFQDRSLNPTYSANMTEIGGRVSGLSSQETTLADVELRGKMNNIAPLEITGKVNPLKQDLYADIRARFTGMDLGPTSPYAGKYVGYTIEKGKLSFELAYHIEKRKLSSENKVFIDQFTFGDKVDSPTATSLPVKLAVALLKDRNGEIHLDIPVTGSIDDPKFSVWSVVLQIIGNLITKAVTSPFALLGAAFGGGEEMQYVEFDPGRSTIPEAGVKKIDALVTALSEKPGLKLELTGHVDPEADREGLKQYLLQRKVKAQKLNDLVKSGSAAVPVDDVVVSKEEYEDYLTKAYRAEPFPKPRNFIGMVKTLPVPEMEKLMLTHIEAGDEELRQLAAQRASAVQAAILASGKVESERLFIVEPKTLAPEKKEKSKESRVDFKIS